MSLKYNLTYRKKYLSLNVNAGWPKRHNQGEFAGRGQEACANQGGKDGLWEF